MAIPGNVNVQQPASVPVANKFDRVTNMIKPLQSMATHYFVAMFWGKTKTGKTRLSATFEKPLLLIDVRERGTKSIEGIDGINIINLESWDQFEDIYYYLANFDHGFKTVVIDTLTQLQDMALEKVVTSKGRPITDKRTMGDWLDAATLMKCWLQSYKNLGTRMNVVFLAQYRERTNDDVTTTRQVVPNCGADLMASLKGFVESLVDVNGWVHVDSVPIYNEQTKKTTSELKHCLMVKPDGIYSVGIRLPEGYDCPARITDPNYEKIQEILHPKKVE